MNDEQGVFLQINPLLRQRNVHKLIFFTSLLLLLLVGTGQTPDSTSARRMLQQAQVLLDSAQYDAALVQSQAALVLAPEGTVLWGECLLAMGDAFLERDNWDAAQDQYQLAIVFFEKKLGLQHPFTAFAFNSLGELFYKKKDHEQATFFYKKALAVRQAYYGEQHESVAASYNNLGNCAISNGRYEEGLALHRKALEIRTSVLPPEHPDLATSYNNIGNCLLLSGDAAAALPELAAALRIRLRAFGPAHPKVAQVRSNLSNCYAALGLHSPAVEQCRLALDIRRRLVGWQHPSLAPALENLGDLYFNGSDYVAALDCYRQAFHILNDGSLDEHAPSVAALWHKIGLCYQYERDYPKALELHLKAENGFVAAFGASHPMVAGLWNNIGNCCAGMNDFDRAVAYYQRAVAVFEKTDLSTDLALTYNNLGLAYLELQVSENAQLSGNPMLRRALEFFQKAEKILPPDPSVELAACLKNQALALERLGQPAAAQTVFNRALQCASATDPMAMMEVLAAQGTALCQRGLQRRDETALRQSVSVLTAALHLSDSLRLGLTAPASRQHWTEQQYPALQSAVEAGVALWKMTGQEPFLEQAFGFAERNRSLQLLDNLRHEQAEHFAGIPDSLLEQEQHWGQVLNRLEKQRAMLGNGGTAEVQTAEAGMAEARQQLAALAERFEQMSPEYWRMKYKIGTVSTATVRQRVLTDGQRALVEYFDADSVWVVFVVTATEFRAVRWAKDPAMESEVRAFRESIEGYQSAAGASVVEISERYGRMAYSLFQKNVAPVLAAAPLPPRWTLVLDGLLTYLPFEALLSELPTDFQRFKSHHYLMRDAQISYAYSATQLTELLATPIRLAPKRLLAMAPAFDGKGSGLRALSHNQPEATAVGDLFGGDVRIGDAATAAGFLASAGDYRILHLATHAQARSTVGDLSYLAFSQPADSSGEAFVYLRDLYLQRLRAELVVLSACETSAGEYRMGEGMVSLAKGFFHAGVRSVVATLWSVDDAKNADLMLRFFQRIKNSDPKDAALRTAKLNYLNAHPHDEAHPVYWAAAVAVGDMQPVDLNGVGGWWKLIALAIVAAVIVQQVIRRLRPTK